MKIKNKILLLFFVIFFALIGCKKIDTPNEAAKELFGKWEYLHDSGGFTDGASRFEPKNVVEYTERGKYTVYDGIEKMKKDRYTFETKMTSYDNHPVTAIVYKKGGYDNFKIKNDTLYLGEEGYDGYNYVFIKK